MILFLSGCFVGVTSVTALLWMLHVIDRGLARHAAWENEQ